MPRKVSLPVPGARPQTSRYRNRPMSSVILEIHRLNSLSSPANVMTKAPRTFSDTADVSTTTASHSENAHNGQPEAPPFHDVDPVAFVNDMRDTFRQCTMNHEQMRTLLMLLNSYVSEVPIDPKTLLGSLRTYKTRPLSNGIYIHFGIRDVLVNTNYGQPVSEIKFQLNVGAISASKYSKRSVWCIQARICHPSVGSPFVVGVFFGRGKPAVLGDFLRETVEELRDVMQSGVSLNGQTDKINVVLTAIICTPRVRSFIRCTKPCMAYVACDKCMLDRGETEAGCSVRLPNVNVGVTSPMDSLGLNTLASFPLEPMHQIYLRLCRKLLSIWYNTPGYRKRMLELSRSLSNASFDIPYDFQTDCGPLQKYEQWEAPECRMFMLYIAVVALKTALPKKQYRNFLNLFCALYCLSHPKLHTYYLPYARLWLQRFVVQYKRLYKCENVVPSIHSLTHLCADVAQHGPIDSFSAFAFEWCLDRLCFALTAKNPSVHLYRRFSEAVCLIQQLPDTDTTDDAGVSTHEGPGLDHFVHRRAIFANWHPDCYAIIDRRAVKITAFNDSQVFYKEYVEQHSFFHYCIHSSSLNILHTKPSTTSVVKAAALEAITSKCFRLSSGDNYVFIPLLHTCT